MKNFFTSMLGALAALVVFAGGCFVLFLGFLMAIAALGGAEKAAPSFERGSYLVFDLSTNITDAPPPIDFGSLRGGREDTLQLRTVTRALHAAARTAGSRAYLSPAG
jgi:protease-4